MVKENLALEIVDHGTNVEESAEFYGCCIYIFIIIGIW